jgi:hypothetical protein
MAAIDATMQPHVSFVVSGYSCTGIVIEAVTARLPDQ